MGGGAEEMATMTSKMALVLAAKSKAIVYTSSPASPNMFASPLHTLASVPFCWEEEPGKPKLHLLSHTYSNRCLELPPRLLLPKEFTKMPLPAAGDAVRRRVRWWLRKKEGKGDAVRGSYVFPSCVDSNRESERGEDSGDINTSVNVVTRIGRDSSLYSLSTPRSHFWADIYKRFKQAVKCKSKKTRKDSREGF
ncbi:PREDICTED: uncharacterized protein At4g00950 [Tarenaya hassleriana]|uniref:uncharacterized protein At4g00950 n=1 Tax=Tarenaya hassleriana TaxID=28532 RepID=UPI00053C59C0|nr:PREDICTED: uncharacterized protein At4g00950 [Tarenaya hassleriana]